MKKLKRDGFSLVELMIAMTITAIVLSGLIALIGYGTKNMRMAHALVALQEQAKDATNHMSSYVMEASDVQWDDAKKLLTVTRETIPQESVTGGGAVPAVVTEKCYYWKPADARGIYFAKQDKVSDPATIHQQKGQNYLLADNVESFQCVRKKDVNTGKDRLHVEIVLQDEENKFECKKDLYMRNQ